jgi:N6-L-threonylcarbamoyladenine synthase
MTILGIETSCDETSAAVVSGGTVRSNVVSSQLVHAPYGGVVPELASRAHQRLIIDVVKKALEGAATAKEDLNGIAATQGPGLVGALLVGLNFGKALAYALELPFVAVNHMEGHLYSNFLGPERPSFPFLCLIVSGGHTMLVLVEAPFRHTILGETRDDAAGEAFDKVAKMLGLGYPGGPVIEGLAREGNANAIDFPRAYLGRNSYDFSFSGVKTAVLYYLRNQGLAQPAGRMERAPLADICASFQAAVLDVLVTKTINAARETGVRDLTIAGGVSANSELRGRMSRAAAQAGCRLIVPPLEYCMDNGAMIAYVGWMKLMRGVTSSLESEAIAYLEIGGE